MSHPSGASGAAFQSNILGQLETRVRELSASAAEARVVLQQAQSDYDCVVEELAALRAQISSLRASLSKKRTRLPARVMYAFPDELLCMIFVELVRDLRSVCWDSWDAVTNIPDEAACLELRRAPLALASVCRRWNRAAVDTTYLWSMVAFSLHKSGNVQKTESYVGLFLERSGTSAVDIAMDWRKLDWMTVQEHKTMTMLLQHLGAAAPRLRRFRMVVPRSLDDDDLEIFNLFRHATPLLEAFQISATYGVKNPFHEQWPRYLPHCPKLSTLSAMRCHVFPFRQPGFPPALESLELACDLPYTAVWELLSLVPNLIRLHFTLLEDPSEEDGEVVYESTLEFPRLRHFACDLCTDYFLSQFKGRIRMPVLESIELLNSDSTEIDEFLPHFADFPITSLTIELEEAEVKQSHAVVFSKLRGLRHLTINAYVMRGFFSHLTDSNGLPFLQTLTLELHGEPRQFCDLRDPKDSLAESLLDFVRARTALETFATSDGDALSGPCRLEHVHFPVLTYVPSWMLASGNLLGLSSALIALSLSITAFAAPAPALGGPKYTLPVEHPSAADLRGLAPHKTFTLPVEPPATARAVNPPHKAFTLPVEPPATARALKAAHVTFTLPTQPPATARAVPTRPPICDVACDTGHVDPTTCSCVGEHA
ncbi:hypothetical protein AURDEDRAFT_182314 [Auricularia subglabra TFB-10046 SS5]|nr:hypothetical protein AURDEDRAFT_182314 [Auricularia subglabra TFB-10046 SS5]